MEFQQEQDGEASWYSIMAREAASGGLPMPAKAKDEPELLRGLELIWDAYLELGSERRIIAGFGGGQYTLIPRRAIMGWCHEMGFDQDEADYNYKLLRYMDVVYLDWQRSKTPKTK